MIANELVKNGFDIKFVDNSYKDFKINAIFIIIRKLVYFILSRWKI